MKKAIGRPKKEIKKSEALRVRLTVEERDELNNLAQELGVPASQIVRRLIREAVNEGPDFFSEGLADLREASRQVAAVGRNLNQLVKLMNYDKPVGARDLEIEYGELLSSYQEIHRAYENLIQNSKQRRVKISVA